MAQLLPNFWVCIQSAVHMKTKQNLADYRTLSESLNLPVFHFLNSSINLLKDPHHRPSEACCGLCGPKPGVHGMFSCGRDPCVYPIQLLEMLPQSQRQWLTALHELFKHLPCLLMLSGPDAWVITLGHTKKAHTVHLGHLQQVRAKALYCRVT